jgi:hypothetical protein
MGICSTFTFINLYLIKSNSGSLHVVIPTMFVIVTMIAVTARRAIAVRIILLVVRVKQVVREAVKEDVFEGVTRTLIISSVRPTMRGPARL